MLAPVKTALPWRIRAHQACSEFPRRPAVPLQRVRLSRRDRHSSSDDGEPAASAPESRLPQTPSGVSPPTLEQSATLEQDAEAETARPPRPAVAAAQDPTAPLVARCDFS